MPRAVAVYRELHCHNCKRTWKQHVWGYDENWTKPRQPLTCVCSTPHIEVLPDWRRSSRVAQVRAEQRCVVYFMPDGSISVPSSNRFDDEIALEAVAGGGVRQEGYHLSDVERWHHDRRLANGSDNNTDDFTDRALLIDYDQQTILSGETYLREGLRREDEARAQVYERQKEGRGIRVYFGGDRYEEAKRRSGR